MTFKDWIGMAVVCGGAVSFCDNAHGLAYNVTVSLDEPYTRVNDVNKNDSLPNSNGNDPQDNLQWLLLNIANYNSALDPDLPPPTTALTINYGNLNGDGPTIPVQAGDYLVLHYGGGAGGGGLVAMYFDAAGTFEIPDQGDGPNGDGGISTARLWDHGNTPDPDPDPVPDSGSSALLLGAALLGIEGARRALARS